MTFRFDVASKTLARGEVEEETPAGWSHPETLVAQNRRRVERVESEAGDTLTLVDAGSGAVVADLGEIQYWWWDVHDLGDGRFFVLRQLGNEGVLDYFDVDGVLQHRVEFGRDNVAQLGGEVAPGRLALGVKEWRSDPSVFEGTRTSILNTETGLVETTIDGFYPLQTMRWGGASSVGPGAWQPGSVSSRLLEAEDGSIHLLDPETGTLKQLIPAVG